MRFDITMIYGLFFLIMALWPDMSLTNQSDSRDIYVKSWKRGQRQIQEQTITVELDRTHLTHKALVKDTSGQDRYEMNITYSKSNGKVSAYWWVLLSEKGTKANLLQEEGVGPNKHNFPKGDYVGVIYPLENPPTDVFEMIKLNTGVWIYPMLARRVIKVENFYCIIKVLEHKIDPKDQNTMDSLKMRIDFTNNYEASK